MSHGPYTERRVKVLHRTIALAGCPECCREKRTADEQRAEREEQARREATRKLRLAQAAIPERFAEATLDGFVATDPEQKTAVERCRWYVADWGNRSALGTSMLFIGRPGTGKTHLACAIARALTMRGVSSRYTTVSAFTRSIRETYNGGKHTETQVLERYAAPALLVLDEVGATAGSDHEKQMLFELINLRYEARRPSLLVSNLTMDEVRGFLGDRIMDRLRDGGGKLVRMDWESFRK